MDLMLQSLNYLQNFLTFVESKGSCPCSQNPATDPCLKSENSNPRPYALNLLQPTGYVKHQQSNIQQLYALPTLYLCVLYLSENKQRLVPLTA